MQKSGSAAGSRSLRFHCRGHRNIRASHHKTLEIIRGAEIGERATCVVGVGADYDPRAVALLAGPVELHLAVNDLEEAVVAEVSWFPSTENGLVLRLSRVGRGNTFAVAADKGARDLSRRLVHALSDPEAVVQATLRERPVAKAPLGALYVLLMDRDDQPSVEERRALVASSAVTGPWLTKLRPWIRNLEPSLETLACREPRDVDGILDRVQSGQRVSLGVTFDDLGSDAAPRALIAAAGAAGIPITCASEASPWVRSVLVSGLAPLPSVVCGRTEGRKAAGALAAAAQSGGTVVWWARNGDLLHGLQVIAELRGPETPALAVRDAGGPRELVIAGPLGQSVEAFLQARRQGSSTATDEEWVAVVGPRLEVEDAPTEGLPEQGLLRSLLAAHVPVKALARAIASTTGTGKREAYAALLALQGKAGEEE